MKNLISFGLIVLSFTACSHGPMKQALNSCYSERAPSADSAVRCDQVATPEIGTFLIGNYKTLVDNSEYGLTQTTFTSVSGSTLRQGPKVPTINPKQVVSFFFPHYSNGTLNRGGIKIHGTPTEIILDKDLNPAYVIFGGQKVRLLEHTAYMGADMTNEIRGQENQHLEGFSSPVGLLEGWKVGLSEEIF